MVAMYDATGGVGEQWGAYLVAREAEIMLTSLQELATTIETLELSDSMTFEELNTFYEEYESLRETLFKEFGIQIKTFDELMLMPLQDRLAYIQGLKSGSYD